MAFGVIDCWFLLIGWCGGVHSFVFSSIVVYRFEWINWNRCNFDIVLRNDGVCGSAEYGNAFLQFSFHERLSAAIVQESWWSVWLRVILERFDEVVVNKLFVAISVCAKLRHSYYVSVPVISCDSGDECLCQCQCASKPEMHLVKLLLPTLYGTNVWLQVVEHQVIKLLALYARLRSHISIFVVPSSCR